MGFVTAGSVSRTAAQGPAAGAEPGKSHTCLDYYYGIGVERSAKKAFQCFQNGDPDYVWLILMTLNGEGTRQSSKQAGVLLAKAKSVPPHESEGLGIIEEKCCDEAMLKAMEERVGDTDVPITSRNRINICDFTMITNDRNICLLDFAIVLESKRKAEFAVAEAKLSPDATASLGRIKEIARRLAKFDGNWKYEQYLAGSGRGTFSARQEMWDAYGFAALRRKVVEAHGLKARTEQEFHASDKELNETYQGVRSLVEAENAAKYQEGLRDAERLWLALEEPWKKLCRELYRGEMTPAEIDRAIATELRESRIVELDEEKQDDLDFFTADIPEFEHFYRGNRDMDKNDWDGAAREYSEVVRLDPEYAVAHRAMAEAMANQKDWDGAAREYGEAIRLNPEDGEAYRGRGAVLQNKKDWDGAIREYRRALALYPKWPEAHTSLAKSFEAEEDWNSAIAEYRELVRLQPDDDAAHRVLAEQLEKSKDWKGAALEYRELVRLKPDDPDAHSSLAWTLENQKDYDGAIAELRKAIPLYVSWPFGHRKLGAMLEAKGDIEGAIAEYREAIRLRPDDPVSHGCLAWALNEKKDWDGALAEYRETLRLRPEWAQVHNNLAGVLHAKGDYDGAIAEAREALRLEPTLAGAHVNVGNGLFAKGNLDGAIAEFREAMRMDPSYPTPHGNLAWVLSQKGDWEGAVTEYREVIRLKPDDAAAHSGLAQALKNRGDDNEALEECRKATELDPRSADIRKTCQPLLTKQKN